VVTTAAGRRGEVGRVVDQQTALAQFLDVPVVGLLVESQQDVHPIAARMQAPTGQPDLEERMAALDLGRGDGVGQDPEARPRGRLSDELAGREDALPGLACHPDDQVLTLHTALRCSGLDSALRVRTAEFRSGVQRTPAVAQKDPPAGGLNSAWRFTLPTAPSAP
jgi:hypothetical protein